jgi:hypothetical protein
MNDNSAEKKDQSDDFASAGGAGRRPGIVSEFIGFMAENKKWWLLPILLVILLLGLVVFLGGSGLAPFIYTLF